ncbi:MAG: electron transfer flavoprotein subunit alpha/FixB family protein [Gammaproteobacteria bacterium]|jgi:electron transfer flavoprotein alpha subunit|nr:electron transfer flavoprotein subunit alpha/FixB family protein [Gammaproteobacteria bacterium]MBT6044316.1 electron transfer flavoprotein subunit alpha/FixB family protein [Gammaproteobacteria bacterium]
MSVLVIAEHNNKKLNALTGNVITAAAKIDADVHILVAGNDCSAVAESSAEYDGVSKVLLADKPSHEHHLPESLGPLVIELATNYTAILLAASTTGKNLAPRVAALLDVAQISDIVAVEAADTFVRPVYAGNALATVQSNDSIKIITVRTSAFDETASGNTKAPIEYVDFALEQDSSRFVSENLAVSERPELAAASIVISGGRGLGSAENFQILEKLADKLGAAIGASRAAVDAGYVGNDLQVGQTGKIVAPDLYIAVGISGAIQHLAGMKDSKVIVAINSDADAPIFQVADYGLVADLFQVLPEIDALLS